MALNAARVKGQRAMETFLSRECRQSRKRTHANRDDNKPPPGKKQLLRCFLLFASTTFVHASYYLCQHHKHNYIQALRMTCSGLSSSYRGLPILLL